MLFQLEEEKSTNFDCRRTVFVTAGEHLPAVVLISGLGDSYKGWQPVFDQIAAFACVLAYNRPGYGESEFQPAGEQGRTGRQVADHLKKTLVGAGVAPPYVLVGHSLGGLYALNYAKGYLEDVAGLLLLDMRAPTYSEACSQQGDMESDLPESMIAQFPECMQAEIKGAKLAERESQSPEGLGERAVTVITSGKPDPGLTKKFHNLWVGEQEKFASNLINGRLVKAQNSAHYVQFDAPDLVVDELKRLVAQVRQYAGVRK